MSTQSTQQDRFTYWNQSDEVSPSMASPQPKSNTATLTTTMANTFLSLPVELQHLIISHLDWHSLTELRLTASRFGTLLIPLSVLRDHYTICHSRTSAHESALSQSTESSATNRASWETRYVSWYPTLPCYRCLRWLPAATHPDSLTDCRFTRRMALVEPHILAPKRHEIRLCIECGMKRGLYGRGDRVGHRPICYGCGALGEELGSSHGSDTSSEGEHLLRGKELRLHYYCRQCVERDRGKGEEGGISQEEIEQGTVPRNRREFMHWRQCHSYTKSMRKTKEYKLEKGRRLRRERGIEEPADENQDTNKMSEPKHTCPVLGEKRWCLCWNTAQTRKHIVSSTQPPRWIW